MRRILVSALLFVVVHAPARAQTDSLSALRFLIGDWQAIDTPPGETGAFTFKGAVQDHVIVRSNEARYAATAEHPASRHDDLLVIYSENGSIKADYFDSEGHVIRYAVRTRQPNAAVFVSDPHAREPRYRLTYTAGANGILTGSFEIAPPGSPDSFKPYLSWKARSR
jgi:hypothetical protein